MMFAGCLKIVAAICLHDAAPVEEFDSTTVTGATITLGDSEIVSIVGSDNPGILDPAKTERRCAQRKCFRYARRCEAKAGGLACTWYWVPDGERNFQRIVVTSPSVSTMESALVRVSFAPFPGVEIAFGTLTYDSGKDYPFCYDEACGARPRRR